MIYAQFEDIPVWQQAREFVVKIYLITKKDFNNDFELMNQIRRAALSILLNIAEGFERKSNKDFARFINQAKASAGECRAALYIAFDLGYIVKNKFEELITNVISISKQLSKFENYLVNSSYKK